MVWGLGKKVTEATPEGAEPAWRTRLREKLAALAVAVTATGVTFADVLEALRAAPAGTMLGRDDAEMVERVRQFLGQPSEAMQRHAASTRSASQPAPDAHDEKRLLTETLSKPQALAPRAGDGGLVHQPFVPSGRGPVRMRD